MEEKKDYQESKNLLVIGRHPVMELLEAGKSVQKIFISRTLKGPLEMEVRSYAKRSNIPLSRVDNHKLDNLSNRRNHQGLAALTSPIEFQELDMIIPHLYEQDLVPLILVLDHITDVRNFGAITRSALALGVHAIVIPSKGTAAINKDAIKSSAGAILKIPICRISNLVEALQLLKNSGISIQSSTLRDAKPISSVDFTIPSAIVVGSEDHGVDNTLIKESNHLFKIPQSSKTDSLNVSVATGIILYEVQLQRSK